MIKKKPKNRIEIDLTGPQGNAFVLLGTARKWYREAGLDEETINERMQDMQSSDYEHLVEVFDRDFGHFVTLYR